ncbi:protein FAM156A/FAM156B-like [Microtus pennsylvanicus]|uniref:protein FAM156A/FAM156B-like n=1 Tax=Microtus pennsylvanicus TaxID=10058 RepID=UPI003F6C691F
MDNEQQSENARSPLKKTKLVKIEKKKRIGSPLPQQAEKKRKSSPPRVAEEEMFKCECRYCQACMGTTSGVSVGTRTEAISHSPSSEKLIQDFHNLTLNPRSTQPPVLPEAMQTSENKLNWQRKNKKGFQKVLRKWTE